MKENERIQHAIMGPLIGGFGGVIISAVFAGKIRTILNMSVDTPNTFLFIGGGLMGVMIGWVFRKYVGELWNIY